MRLCRRHQPRLERQKECGNQCRKQCLQDGVDAYDEDILQVLPMGSDFWSL